jgi:hypothetical protein
MENNKLENLRDHLFATLEALRDPENPMDLDRAQTIADVAREITASAKVEVDFIRVTGQNTTSDFFPRPALPGTSKPNGKTLEHRQ